jgi:signal peptidase II
MINLLASGVLFLIIDQASKRLIELRFADRTVDCGPYLRIRRVSNAQRLYRRSGFRVALVVVWSAAFVSALILTGRGSFTGVVAAIGIGAALGGALGNLLDIIRTKSVRDFIDLGWWPVFNVADVAIIGGLAAAFLRR